jgi:hypothetical protein
VYLFPFGYSALSGEVFEHDVAGIDYRRHFEIAFTFHEKYLTAVHPRRIGNRDSYTLVRLRYNKRSDDLATRSKATSSTGMTGIADVTAWNE